MRLKIAIGEKKPHVSIMLRDYMETDDFDIAGTVDNGIALDTLIETKKPDIVITEIDLPNVNGLDIVKIHKHKHMQMDFIVIDETKNFDNAIRAIRAGVSDFLVKPITHDKLYTAFHASVTREISKIVHIHDNDFALRCYYVGNLKAIMDDHMSMEATNMNYGTRYKEGIFQCAFVKVDCATGIEWFSNNMMYAENIKSIFFEELSNLCHDLLFEPKFDGILVIMNYSPVCQETIHQRLEQILVRVKQMFNTFYEIEITLCVGAEYDTLSGLKESRRQAFEALWARMVMGTGNVIFWKKQEEEIPEKYQRELKQIKERFNVACNQLNIEEIKGCVHSLFRFPKNILVRPEFRNYMQDMTADFFENNKELLSIMAEGGSRNEFLCQLKVRKTLKDYEETYISLITEIFRRIEQNSNKQGLIARTVADYVSRNYDQKISLEDVARELMLSPAYFSTVYKSLTGKNFTDYVTEYRMDVAKDLLLNSNLNVAEIANKVSFQDPHYFSRVFKRNVGVKPSEYRKNHGQ